LELESPPPWAIWLWSTRSEFSGVPLLPSSFSLQKSSSKTSEPRSKTFGASKGFVGAAAERERRTASHRPNVGFSTWSRICATTAAGSWSPWPRRTSANANATAHRTHRSAMSVS
jgi:hypothetical protein